MKNFEEKDAVVAFKKAIQEGRLTDNPKDMVWAGNFMYMGRVDGKDMFKHIDRRFYLD